MDFVKLRKERYARQKDENPKLQYKVLQSHIACTEVSLILRLFGDGHEVPLNYAKFLVEKKDFLGWKSGRRECGGRWD